jgi:hypothetical protein
MENRSNNLLPQPLFYLAVLALFIVFLAFFTHAIVNVLAIFETNAYATSIAEL